jgi:chromosome segregation ATPase
MRNFKRVIIWCAVFVAFVAVVGGVALVVRYIVDGRNGYTGKDLNGAYAEGKKQADAYRERLEALINGVIGDIGTSYDTSALDDLNASFYAVIADLDDRLSEQGADVVELTEQKKQSLISMRDSLGALLSEYEDELISLNGELADIDAAIAELEELDSDLSAEILGFTVAKSYVENRIDSVESIVAEITEQIGLLDAQISAM